MTVTISAKARTIEMGWPRDGSLFPEPTWWNGDPPPTEQDDDQDEEPMPELLKFEIDPRGDYRVVAMPLHTLSEQQLMELRASIPTLVERLWELRRSVIDERNRRAQSPASLDEPCRPGANRTATGFADYPLAMDTVSGDKYTLQAQAGGLSPGRSVECPYCKWGFAPSAIAEHIREKHGAIAD
jgi:hypothetical protein